MQINGMVKMAKYIFRCINNARYACNVGDYCTGHSWCGDDGYTHYIVFATVYDEAVKKDADEIAVIDLDCYGDFEKIEVTE